MNGRAILPNAGRVDYLPASPYWAQTVATRAADMFEPGSMDISQHKSVYGSFIGLTKFTIIGCIILLALMALFLV